MKFISEFSIILTLFGCLKAAENTLIAVNLIFRHGDRCPEKSNLYESSPYYNESYFKPYGFGQLTNKGKLTIYNLGKEIRELYKEFLDESYSIDLIEARSSDFNRTKASLQLFLAGLFPPTKELVWLEGFNWQPIPYTYKERAVDEELFAFGCENWDLHLSEYLETSDGSKLLEKYKDLFKYLTEYTGEVYNDILKAYYLYFGFETLEQLNYSLPEWSKEIYPQTLNQVVMDYYDMITSTSTLRQLTAGYLLKHILEDMQKKIVEENTSKKMFIWSAHENNIMAVLKVMKLWNGDETIKYGSYVVLELHYIDEVFGFKVFFKNDVNEVKQLKIPGCEDFCPLNDFKQIVQRDIPDSISVCRGEKSSSVRALPSVNFKIFVYFYLLFMFIQ